MPANPLGDPSAVPGKRNALQASYTCYCNSGRKRVRGRSHGLAARSCVRSFASHVQGVEGVAKRKPHRLERRFCRAGVSFDYLTVCPPRCLRHRLSTSRAGAICVFIFFRLSLAGCSGHVWEREAVRTASCVPLAVSR
ncbi:hypothetical protein MRX96_040366 [Rhipicephalus microplus]